MKQHLLILVGEYKPYLSPNRKIVSLLLNELKKEYRITVLTGTNLFGIKKEKTDNETIEE